LLSQQESSPVFTQPNKRISYTAIIFRPSQLNTKSIAPYSRYLITPIPAILIITPFYRHVLLTNRKWFSGMQKLHKHSSILRCIQADVRFP